MIVSEKELERLKSLGLPEIEETIAAMEDYMAHADLTVAEFSERCGYGCSTLRRFRDGNYESNDGRIREAIWDYIRRHPIGPRLASHGQLFETQNVRIIRSYFQAAIERSEICLIYGPPGTQKSFTLEHLIWERNRQKKSGSAIYVYASADMTATALMKRIGRECGIRIGYQSRERVIQHFIDYCAAQKTPPALIVDEAQHLALTAIETVRELHDRASCGVILTGSHDLFEKFLKSRAQLEQWLSRIDHKEPLPGLDENEVREIAESQLERKLSEKQRRSLVDACRVDDVFARGADGRPAPSKYLSVRRLVKTLQQFRAAKEKVA